MTEVIVRDADGTEESLTHDSSTVERDQNRLPTSRVLVPRSEANDVTFDEASDEVYIRESGTDEFGGILKDVIRASSAQQGETELVVESFERLAKDGTPTAPKEPYENASDSAIISDALSRVPGITEGNITTIETDVNVLFQHATPALQIRLMRALSKGELRYNPNKTLDYLSSIGSDRTATTISPTNQNIGDLRKVTETGGPHKTHLRILGAGGTYVNVVADSFDPTADREKWGRALFREVEDKPTLRQLGDRLLDDLSQTWLEVEAELVSIAPDPALGDTFTVDYPDENIDTEELRIANLKTTRDDDGIRWSARLTNRSFARTRDVEELSKQADQSARTGQTSTFQNVPTTNFPMVDLPSGKKLDQVLIIAEGKVLYLWLAETEVDESSATNNVDICIKLVENPGASGETVIYSQCTSSYKTGNPLARIEAPSGGKKVAIRLENTAGSNVPASGGAAFTIEEMA